MGDAIQCLRHLPKAGRDDTGLKITPAPLWSGTCLQIRQRHLKR